MQENETIFGKYEYQPPSKEELSMTIDECVERADEIISQNGICLMLMDIAGSRETLKSAERVDDFVSLATDLNELFEEYLPENNLTAPSRLESGFNIMLGDALTAGVSSSEIIPMVADYVQENYPDFEFYYGVAVDCYEGPIIRIVK